MQYREDKYGRPLSILGFGCLRLPKDGRWIDPEAAERVIMAACEAGVNYFDTAYVYPGSEEVLGTVLERNGVRDRVYIATKLPHYLIRSREGLEKLFREQLARLRTDHIDYYLMHMLTDVGTWERLKALGVEDWLVRGVRPLRGPLSPAHPHPAGAEKRRQRAGDTGVPGLPEPCEAV